MARARKVETPAAFVPTDEPWWHLASIAVQRLAVLHRITRGRSPDALARLDDGQVDAVLLELTGAHDAVALEDARGKLDKVLLRARVDFTSSLAEASAFSALAGNARLQPAEAEVLAIACAVEADPRLQRLVAYVQDDPGATRVELHTLGRIFGDDHLGPVAVGSDSGLRRAGLLQVSEDGPWSRHVVVVEPSVLWALAGDTSSDPALPSGVQRVLTSEERGDPLVVVSGPDRVRRRQTAAARTLGTRFLVSGPPTDTGQWTALVREATITGAGIVLEVDDELPPEGRRWIERAGHLPWAVSARAELPLRTLPDRPWIEWRAEAHDPTEDEWRSAFGENVERRHRLSAEQLVLVSRAFHATEGDVDAAVRRLVSGKLEHLARRISPTRTWDDIVLTPDRLGLLHELTGRYLHASQVYDEWGFRAEPSRGLVALFSGPSGTGKTLAAEIIAGELGLDVFKLDLSAVVSKYIGETEKNLEEVFEAAGAGNVVLFFDEADSLFGKRSEVRDARDRYANIEVSYLLQRLESYDGMVVLATNFEKNIDDAFLRRIHTRVDFVLPDVTERRAIWLANLPPTAPVENIDVDDLARRFELSGGAIRNAVLHAAFMAAEDGTPITMATAMRGVGREYLKMGRLLRPGDFGDYHDLVARTAEDSPKRRRT